MVGDLTKNSEKDLGELGNFEKDVPGACHNHKGESRDVKDGSTAMQRLEDRIVEYGSQCDTI